MSLIMNIAVAGIAGWLAGFIMQNKSSIFLNIIVGIIGGIIGNMLTNFLGITAVSVMGHLLISAVGACIVIGFLRVAVK